MPETESRQSPEEILNRIEWSLLRRLDGLLYGDYRTFFRGIGLDLADLREYQYHDEVRHIDWNVTARLQTPYVREFNEDREVTVWFLLDISPSVDFGSMDVKKRSVLTDFVTVLSRLMTRRGNRVGAILYSDGIEEVIPPRSGRTQVLYLINRLLNRPKAVTSKPTDLTDFLNAALHIIKRRSLVFVISDFISEPGWSRPMRYLVRRHEVVGIRLFDPLEVELPDIGLFLMQDAETGEQIFVDTNDKGFRRRFQEAAEKREVELMKSLQEAGVDTLELSTEDDLVDAIMRFADLRKHRIQMAARGGLPSHMES